MFKDNINKENPLRVLSLFSGIGAFEKALTNLDIPHRVVNYCEVDPYPAKAYSLIHNIPEELNLGDVMQIKASELEDFDLLVGGSPCTDFSIAGKMAGATWTCTECGESYNPLQADYKNREKCIKCGSDKIEKTRSSLIVEILRITREKKPKYLVYENVKDIINKKFKDTFDLFVKELEDYGYVVKYKVLNSKDFGIPQNRERVFVVAQRRDIYEESNFEFPIGMDKGVRLKHLLEQDVSNKYYIPEERCKTLLSELKDKITKSNNGIIQITNPKFSQQRVYSAEGNAPTICAGTNGGGKEPCKIIEFSTGENKIINAGMLDGSGYESIRRVYDPNGISPTITTMQGGNTQPKVLVEEFVSKNELNCVGAFRTNNFNEERKSTSLQGYRVYDVEGIARALLAIGGGIGGQTGLYLENFSELSEENLYATDLKIRKLIPLETFKLMGFTTEDFKKIESEFSDTRLYKMAGNSIVVQVLEAIFENLFDK